MIILPAIDLLNGQVVRLLHGDYSKVTVYDSEPLNTAINFKSQGTEWLHIVDLDGAKSGNPKNFDVIKKIKNQSDLKCEVGGGIRDFETIEKYINSGIDRIILGTAAVTKPGFVEKTVKIFQEKIAVGIDIKNNKVAIKGWVESSDLNALDFCEKMRDSGVKFVICTDISRDGAMTGANLNLYENLKNISGMNFIASGGVNSIEDVKKLANLNLYGAIIGRAYYTGAVNIKQAIDEAK